MPLDFAILGDDGAPARQVSLGVDTHHRLMGFVSILPGPLGCVADYYGDFEYTPTEIPGLLRQVDSILANGGAGDAALRSFLLALKSLASAAQLNSRSLVVLAD